VATAPRPRNDGGNREKQSLAARTRGFPIKGR